MSPAAQVAIDFANQGSAASQRTTPIISSHLPNLVSDKVQVDDAGNMHYIDPETGQLVATDKTKHVILTDPADNTPKVFARTPQTDEGVLSATGRLLGMGMGAGPMQVTKAAPAVIGAAERLGINVPNAITTASPLKKFIGQAVIGLPGGGPLQSAVNSSVDQLGNAVQTAAAKAGGTVDAAVAGGNYGQGIKDSFKPAMKSGLKAAYDNVSMFMDPKITTPLQETQGRVSNILAQRGAAKLNGTGKAVDLVSNAVREPGGLTFEGLKTLRSHVGDLLNKGIFPEGMSEGELRHIYGGLSEDLKTAALKSGGPRGAAALERANELFKQVAVWKEKLKKVLGPPTRSGEGVSDAIIRMASSGAGADIETLAKARSAVPKEVWQDIASTAISRLGVSRNGEFTPAAFATAFRKLSDRGRMLLFRSVGSGDVLPFLNDIAEVSQKFVDAGKLANTSGTAGHNALYTMGGAIATGATAAIAGAGVVGSAVPPLMAIASITGINGIARLLSRPATASSIARWARVYSAAIGAGTPTARIALESASKHLARVAAQNGVDISPVDLMKAAQTPDKAEEANNQN
jgi:hypothetical protein